MKKFAALALLVVMVTACTKEYYDINTFTKYYTVKSSQWKKGSDATGFYYYYTVKEAALTNTVLNNGSLNAYLYYAVDDIDTFSPLPYSDFIVDKDGYKWEEHITIEYQPGYITFILKPDDHYEDKPFYESYEFMVRFLW